MAAPGETFVSKGGFPVLVWLSLVATAIVALTVETGAAQEPSPPIPQSVSVIPASPQGIFGGPLFFATIANTEGAPLQVISSSAGEVAGGAVSIPDTAVHPVGIQRITLEQVKQQTANRAISPLARLGQLQIEAAKQHRLGVQADYFPKFAATFANLHYTEFLGKVIEVRSRDGSQVPIPLFSQNWTIAALTFTQPITPIFHVRQAVRVARPDERIAMAKGGAAIAKSASDSEIETNYFRLLIASCRLASARLKLRNAEHRPEYVTVSTEPGRVPGQDSELVEARKALTTAAAEVKDLSASLNRVFGWPEDTELELVPPDPLVENISLDQVANKSAAANPDVIEAEQTLVKARAAALSKPAYVPTVAATAGYLFQNAIPLTPSNFGYGGVMVSYNLFDFGKREHSVKEARAQLEMAELGLQLTKAKVASDLKKSYLELERTRQLSPQGVLLRSLFSDTLTVALNPRETL